ncbi:MAG TPA: isoprenyl transferase [Thermodesulfobacteriota bacterium]|nr:isoprenyl transferase [Thermodesulfobacteriota bacterium]
MEELRKDKLPQHIAIIMDGNGRWASRRNLKRILGHERGIATARKIVEFCRTVGIPVVTLYAFSVENWKRPKSEIQTLLNLLEHYLRTESDDLLKHNIRLVVIGNMSDLPPSVAHELNDAIEKSRACDGMILNLALSYGGRGEIVQAVRSIVADVSEGRLRLENVNETTFSQYLYTRGLPDPDLLIRTSGEMRLSNFLLWQMAYTEIYVTDTLWPDFSPEEMTRILLNYQTRERRFGQTSEQLLQIVK